MVIITHASKVGFPVFNGEIRIKYAFADSRTPVIILNPSDDLSPMILDDMLKLMNNKYLNLLFKWNVDDVQRFN